MFRKDKNVTKRVFIWRQNVNKKKTVRLHLQGGWDQRECGQNKRHGDMEHDYSELTAMCVWRHKKRREKSLRHNDPEDRSSYSSETPVLSSKITWCYNSYH
jgi:hypothetical protein